MSHNEDDQQKRTWQHFFLPGTLRLFIEIAVALALVVAINFATFESNFLYGITGNITFSSYVSLLLIQLLTMISQSPIATQIIIFALWAIVGMLVYIVGFRIIQAIYGVSSSMSEGFSYIKAEKSQGVLRWFNTLHNFFLRLITHLLSIILFGLAGFLAFAFAVQQMRKGLGETGLETIIPLGLGITATIIGVRLLVMGACLIMPRFARWYLA